MEKKQWVATLEQNSGEYEGWVQFFAEKAIPCGMNCIDADGFIMEFDEAVISIDLVE